MSRTAAATLVLTAHSNLSPHEVDSEEWSAGRAALADASAPRLEMGSGMSMRASTPRQSAPSRAEQLQLAKRVRAGDRDARDDMVEANLGLVISVAREHAWSDVPMADLVQQGTIGLIQAVERFDYRREVQFSTYAVWWIRREVRSAIANARPIRIPPRTLRELTLVRQAEIEIEQRGRRYPSDDDIASRTGLRPSKVRAIRSAATVTVSLDDPAGTHGAQVRDLIPDSRGADPSQTTIDDDIRSEVRALVEHLSARQQTVVTRHFGLDRRAQGHRDIAASLGVGEERSRQIEREALHRLRILAAERLG